LGKTGGVGVKGKERFAATEGADVASKKVNQEKGGRVVTGERGDRERFDKNVATTGGRVARNALRRRPRRKKQKS